MATSPNASMFLTGSTNLGADMDHLGLATLNLSVPTVHEPTSGGYTATPAAGYLHFLNFNGTDLTYDAAGLLTGGKIVDVQIVGNGSTFYAMPRTPIDATDLMHWIQTGDDASLVNALMAGDDSLVGSAGADLIRGRLGNDNLFGDAGADTMFGGLGADTLSGGAGDDLLDGNNGEDYMLGGRRLHERRRRLRQHERQQGQRHPVRRRG